MPAPRCCSTGASAASSSRSTSRSTRSAAASPRPRSRSCPAPRSGAWDWLAALIAILVTTVVADLCIFAVISLSEGRATLQPLLEMLTLSLPFTLGSAAVGLVLARSAASDPAALALLALPTVLIVAAYRAYTHAREQQENLRLLHEVTSLLHNGDTAGGARRLPRVGPLGVPRRAGRAGPARAGRSRRRHGQPQRRGLRADRHGSRSTTRTTTTGSSAWPPPPAR